MTPYQQYIYKSRYARYLPDEKRREEWPETVERYINFFKERNPKTDIPWKELEDAIVNFEVPEVVKSNVSDKRSELDNDIFAAIVAIFNIFYCRCVIFYKFPQQKHSDLVYSS